MTKKSHATLGLFTAFLGLLYISLSPVYAGGGRIEIENLNGVGLTGNTNPSGLYIGARLYTDADHTNTVTGEKAEFRVQNPRPGDQCTTRDTTVNAYGQIFGQCFADQPGTITIYVHSLNRGDDSSIYLLTFVAPRATPTPTPSPVTILPQSNTSTSSPATPTPMLSPTATPTSVPQASVSPSPTPTILVLGLAEKSVPMVTTALVFVVGVISAMFFIFRKRVADQVQTPLDEVSPNGEMDEKKPLE